MVIFLLHIDNPKLNFKDVHNGGVYRENEDEGTYRLSKLVIKEQK
jgi:hypothetical protein